LKWLFVAVVVIAGFVGVVAIVGAFRPKQHVASHTVVLAAPPERVWEQIADMGRQAEWVPDVTKVERLGDRDGKPSYRENYGRFTVTTVVTTAEAPRLLVKEILPGGPFSGSWTWELAPEGTGTRLTITERGTVESPLFRGMMVFADNTKSARRYAAALAKRLGVGIEERQ
jgi:uncharacterized protein YndB with AHSA1/START domain